MKIFYKHSLKLLMCLIVFASTTILNAQTGTPGNALNFDGNNNYVDCGNASNLQITQGTIEAWIRTSDAGPDYRGIVVKNYAYGLYLKDNILVAYGYTSGTEFSTGINLADGKWHHVALSFDASVSNGSSIYVDGNLALNFTFDNLNQNFGLAIGCSLGSGAGGVVSQFFTGSIDEVRVWNSIRTQTQLQAAMYNVISASTANLTAYYNFNNGTANANNVGITNLTDSTSNANNGTLNNFILNGNISNWVESYAMVVPTATAATSATLNVFTANWTAPAIGVVDNYLLDVSIDSSFVSYVSGYNGLSVSGTSQAVTGLNPSTTYYYRVSANKASVTGQGGYSNKITTSTNTCSITTSTFTVTACDTYTWVAKGNKVYTVSNNTDTITLVNAGGCDSVITLNLTINNSSSSTTTTTSCDSLWWNGIKYTSSGTYTFVTPNAVGCDSTATLVLTVNNSSTSLTTASACDSLTWNGVKYTSSGTYTFSTTNSVGCDSTATLVLTINHPSSSTTNRTLCNGQLPYTWNGLTFNTAGTQTAHLTNSAGCDSAATLVLATIANPSVTIQGGKAFCGSPATTKLTATIVPNNGGVSYLWKSLAFNDNNWQVAGIDSTINVSVALPTQYQLTVTIAGCGTLLSNQQGVIPVTPPNVSLSPSPVTSICNNNIVTFTASSTNTDINNYAFYQATNLLQNDTAKTYNTPILTTANNGQVYTVEATNNKPVFNGVIDENFWGIQLASSMSGAAPSFGAGHELNALYARADSNNVYFAIAGNVKDQNRIMLFIDSKVGGYNNGNYGRGGLGNIAMRNINSGITFDAGFYADYILGIGTDATSSQYYFDLYTMSGTAGSGGGPNNYLGTNLSPASGYSLSASPANGLQTRGFEIAIPKTAIGYTGGDIQVMAMYSADNGFLSNQFLTRANLGAGSYGNGAVNFGAAPPNPISIPLETMQASCKAIVTTTVTVKPNLTSTTTTSACDSFVWNNVTYKTSGIYTFTALGSNGCDSIATLNLTINHPTVSTNNIAACDSLVWNGTTYFVSGTYTYATTNSNGCDSTATLNLTINHPSTSSVTQTVCDSLIWNNVKYTSSGTYTYVTPNAMGCDSTASLILTVNHSTTSVTTQTVCDSLTWNNIKYTSSGTYTYTTPNAVGCDSTAKLVLTVNHSITITTTQTACDSLTWNGLTYFTSGIYTYSTTSAAGCDSTTTLNLTINVTPVSPTITTSTLNVTIPATAVAYSCNTVSGATTYTWSYTGTGVTIASGQGTTAITADFDATATNGDIQVVASNGTCSSAPTTASIILPTTLSNFVVSKVNKTVLVKWTTASEINSKNFEVQRSIDGRNFVTVGTIAAKGFASEYSYVDEKPFTGVNYFRLKQVDNDGKFAISIVKHVKFGADVKFVVNIYPNPATEILNVSISNADAKQINILNILGKIIYSTNVTTVGTIQLPTKNLSAGTYFVEIISNENRAVEKFIKK